MYRMYPHSLFMWTDGAIVLETTTCIVFLLLMGSSRGTQCRARGLPRFPGSPFGRLRAYLSCAKALHSSAYIVVFYGKAGLYGNTCILRQDVPAGIFHFSILWLSLLPRSRARPCGSMNENVFRAIHCTPTPNSRPAY